MRLTKVQKALKEAKIEYSYKEETHHGYVFGEIRFEFQGKKYMVDEITSNRGNKPSGVYTNINDWGVYCNQGEIAEAIENMGGKP